MVSCACIDGACTRLEKDSLAWCRDRAENGPCVPVARITQRHQPSLSSRTPSRRTAASSAFPTPTWATSPIYTPPCRRRRDSRVSAKSMELASTYEIERTAEYVRSGNFRRVALQFPDELLKDSPLVAKALRQELKDDARRFYVMADTAYGSCCVDEVAAAHVDADCVVHYGHACMSPTSTLPALFVFGKENVDIDACVESLCCLLSASKKPILVLFGLEYAHAIPTIKSSIAVESLRLGDVAAHLHFAQVTCNSIKPIGAHQPKKSWVDPEDEVSLNGKVHSDAENRVELHCSPCSNIKHPSNYSLGGLTWILHEETKMEDYTLFWIGPDNSAFANVVLTFNSCDVVRFDAKENCLVEDLSHLKRILKRRYYLVEKAKDANIVGILVGTLGVADYLNTVQQIKELIEVAGKTSYTLVMGRPSPAKLANFPECDVFVLVSCAQTALLDSKDFLAPVITPFEATLAFSRDSNWTGDYVVDFRDVKTSSGPEDDSSTEARFSFLKGGYIEDTELQGEERDRSIVLSEITKNSLSLKASGKETILFKGEAKSAGEYLLARSFRGLEINHENSAPKRVVIGRTGRASGYKDEKEQEKTQR